jgi:hypothetical protein
LADLNTSTLFSVFRTDDDLVTAMRRRAAYIGASYGLIDQLTEMGEGSTGKYLSPARARQLTINSAMRICEALGLRLAVVVDEKLVAEMSPSWGGRDVTKVNAGRRAIQLGAQSLKRARPQVLSELGRKGAIARNTKLTPAERHRLAIRAARARWNRKTGAHEHGRR